METAFTKKDILRTNSLEEAVELLFGIKIQGRQKVLLEETFSGEIGAAYDFMGRHFRCRTYENIAEDFMVRIGIPEDSKVETDERGRYLPKILEVGCGSGLLSIAVAKEIESASILGIDVSPAMIGMAQRNVGELSTVRNLRINFRIGNVYELPDLLDIAGVDNAHYYGTSLENVDYIICRNVLHRLNNPVLAIRKMYESLSPGGKLYLRDLQRDAPWEKMKLRLVGGYSLDDDGSIFTTNTIRDEEKEKMWFPGLVKDKVGAMANMFTCQELADLLRAAGIKKYTLTDGRHRRRHSRYDLTTEYAQSAEYVCVIER